ncbi:hypothetical protein KR222_003856 [Zaprionus bogoriensis]|nr:hypothetical protein KR222_003856 [Zaprionus bogoriensis]
MTTHVRELKEEDFDAFNRFLLDHFYTQEPLLQTPGDHFREEPELLQERLEAIRQGLSVVAVDQNERIVGVAYAEQVSREGMGHNWLEIKGQKPTKLIAHIHYFLSNLENKSEFFKHYDVSQALYLAILTVDASVTRQGLGRRLVSALMEVGRSKGLPLLVTTCTSVYSQRVMAALGFEVVLSQKYSDYKDEDGNMPLQPPAPHQEASVMAIRL